MGAGFRVPAIQWLRLCTYLAEVVPLALRAHLTPRTERRNTPNANHALVPQRIARPAPRPLSLVVGKRRAFPRVQAAPRALPDGVFGGRRTGRRSSGPGAIERAHPAVGGGQLRRAQRDSATSLAEYRRRRTIQRGPI